MCFPETLGNCSVFPGEKLGEKLTPRGDLAAGFSCLTVGVPGEGRASLFSAAHSNEMRGCGYKLQKGRYPDLFFSPTRAVGSNTGTRAQGGCEVSVLRDIQTLTRHSPKQPALSWHCHLQRFGLETSQLYHHRGEQLLESHNSGEVLQQTRMATRRFSLLQISFVKKFHKLFSGEARIGSTCSLLVFIL